MTTSLGNIAVLNHPIDEEPFPHTQPDSPLTQLHAVPREKISVSIPCEEDVHLPLQGHTSAVTPIIFNSLPELSRSHFTVQIFFILFSPYIANLVNCPMLLNFSY